MEKWFVRNKNIDYKKIAKKYGISEVISKILINRNIYLEESIDTFLYGGLDSLHSPSTMYGIKNASNIIKESIGKGEKIRIVGDYDVDGVMSIYILYTSLVGLGANIDFVIPDRIKDGYGINERIVERAKEDGVELLITCDNGISAFEPVELANDLGIKVIITDHHDLTYRLEEDEKVYVTPEADAVINPKNPKCNYPFELLCGAGVAYKLVEYIFSEEKEEIYPLLEYVAIATVCDVVDLVDENRIMVKHGLKLINNTKNIGVKSLIEVLGIEKELGIYHLGFIIGPIINASGRLESALVALELLLTEDKSKAMKIAKDLKALNEERKNLTGKGFEDIVSQIEEEGLNQNKILVVYDENIHESVAGIIAGRIKDSYNKPTIVLTKSSDGVKGSGRSIKEYNIFEELNKSRDLLSNFGGHPMAAGLSLKEKNILPLRERLNNITTLTEEDIYKKIYIDLALPISFLNDNFMDDLKSLEPFGKGNAKPLFGDKGLKIKKLFKFGKEGNVLKFNLYNGRRTYIDAVLFNDTSNFEEMLTEKYGERELQKLYKGVDNDICLDLIYYPKYNEYRGRKTIQIIIESYRI